MQILFYSRNFYPHVGGTEEQAKSLAIELQNKGHNVIILTSRTNTSLKKFEYIQGLPVIRHKEALYKDKIGGGRLSSIVWILSIIYHLFWLRNRYNIAHLHLASRQAALISFINSLLKRPTLVKIANTGEGSELAKLKYDKIYYGKYFYKLFRFTSIFIATTRFMKEELIETFNIPEHKISLIPNGVDTEAISRIKPQETDAYDIVFVGRLVHVKRSEILVKAIKELKNNGNSCKVAICGDGVLYSNIKRQILDYGLQSQIDLLGNVDHAQVLKILKASKIYVSCSQYEGLSNSLLEAMAAECVCVVSNISANVELMYDNNSQNLQSIESGDFLLAENGILINTDDSSATCRAIQFIIQNPDKQQAFASRAQNFAQQHYSFRNVVTKLEGLYSKL